MALRTQLLVSSAVAFVVAAVASACGSSDGPLGFGELDGGGGSSDGGDNADVTGFQTGDSSTGPAGCKNLQCKVADCGTGTKTTLTGKAFAPNGVDPLYNVIVYVPNADLKPFPSGVSCDKCGAITSGEPIATALSGPDGTFRIENVPTGDDVPLVLQVGRWRRLVKIPRVDSCKETALAPDLTRLPRNKAEGDIPLMALATSPYDPEECILKKIGIDVAEFTVPSGNGRVHVYKGAGATLQGATPPPSSDLWATTANLSRYDITMFPCQTSGKPDANGTARIKEYPDNGGRVFVTDLSMYFVSLGPAPWPTTANWGGAGSFTNPGLIDTTFPKGQALADWLQATGATPTKGQLTLNATFHRFSTANPPSQRWVYSSTDTQTYSFNTPVGVDADNQCGRVVYSSFHIASGAGSTFPAECDSNPLTAQEKVLEFLLFDLAACIQKDDSVPVPPPPVK